MKRKEVSIFNVKLLIIWRRHLKIARWAPTEKNYSFGRPTAIDLE